MTFPANTLRRAPNLYDDAEDYSGSAASVEASRQAAALKPMTSSCSPF